MQTEEATITEGAEVTTVGDNGATGDSSSTETPLAESTTTTIVADENNPPASEAGVVAVVPLTINVEKLEAENKIQRACVCSYRVDGKA